MNKIKFLRHGIKFDGKRVGVWYSKGSYTKISKIPKGTITIYAKKYSDSLPKILRPKNEINIQTDYFAKDIARVRPTSKYYKQILKYV